MALVFFFNLLEYFFQHIHFFIEICCFKKSELWCYFMYFTLSSTYVTALFVKLKKKYLKIEAFLFSLALSFKHTKYPQIVLNFTEDVGLH